MSTYILNFFKLVYQAKNTFSSHCLNQCDLSSVNSVFWKLATERFEPLFNFLCLIKNHIQDLSLRETEWKTHEPLYTFLQLPVSL